MGIIVIDLVGGALYLIWLVFVTHPKNISQKAIPNICEKQWNKHDETKENVFNTTNQ